MKSKSSSMPLSDGATVTIIGGGPAGASAAIRLLNLAAASNRKLRVVVFEGKDFTRHFNQCVGVLSPPFKELMEKDLQIPFPEHLVKRVVRNYRLLSEGKDIVLESPPGEEPTYILRRVQFDHYMLEQAVEAGAELIRSRVHSIEFVCSRAENSSVRVYSDDLYLEADCVVVASGLDDGTLFALEEATSDRWGEAGYKRPPRFFRTIITKFHIDPGFIEERFGDTIYAYMLSSIPNVEFGAITPKGDHVIINVAGERVSSRDMDAFLTHPQVSKNLPRLDLTDVQHFRGKFPTSRARGACGDNYVVLGDATGWMRAFKGKGINTALYTGIQAANTMMNYGISRADFKHYADSCTYLTEDHFYGKAARALANVAVRSEFMDRIIRIAENNETLREFLYESVSGQKSFREILVRMANIPMFARLSLGFAAQTLGA